MRLTKHMEVKGETNQTWSTPINSIFGKLLKFTNCEPQSFLDKTCCMIEIHHMRKKKKTTPHIWVFPKIAVPQNGWFIMENPIKMDDLGMVGNTHILTCTFQWVEGRIVPQHLSGPYRNKKPANASKERGARASSRRKQQWPESTGLRSSAKLPGCFKKTCDHLYRKPEVQT